MPPKSQSALAWPCWSRVEMAACPDVLAMPGVVVGSVLLLVLSSNPAWGESVTIPTSSTHPSDHTSTHTYTPLCPVMINKEIQGRSRANLKHEQARQHVVRTKKCTLCLVRKRHVYILFYLINNYAYKRIQFHNTFGFPPPVTPASCYLVVLVSFAKFTICPSEWLTQKMVREGLGFQNETFKIKWFSALLWCLTPTNKATI